MTVKRAKVIVDGHEKGTVSKKFVKAVDAGQINVNIGSRVMPWGIYAVAIKRAIAGDELERRTAAPGTARRHLPPNRADYTSRMVTALEIKSRSFTPSGSPRRWNSASSADLINADLHPPREGSAAPAGSISRSAGRALHPTFAIIVNTVTLARGDGASGVRSERRGWRERFALR
jgi:hypothetical protein